MRSFFRFLFSLRTIVVLLLVAALAGGAAYLYYMEAAGAAGTGFRTEPAVKKNLSATITATGTLEPEEVIDVGAQVAGLILNFGPADPKKPDGPLVDYCTPVTKGQVLASIDPTIYQAQLDAANATFATAQAAQASAEASLAKSEANRNGMLDAYQRDAASPGAVNQQQMVADKAAYEAAVADCKLQAAAIKQAEASIKQATATLKQAQTNLNYCTITAPVDGVIVDRRVNVGQTVVSSLSAPSLFLLAKDLMRMQVWASVNEADIGNIHIGQEVTFTVDARPGKVFRGNVSQIRFNASMTQNVVTYTVVVETTNRMIDVPTPIHVKTPSGAAVNTTPAQELELLPYLTANLTFHVADRENALLVPNAALRRRPQLAQVAEQYRDDYQQSLRKKTTKESSADDATAAQPAADSGGKKPAKPHGGEGGAASRGMVWVQEGTLVRPIKLVTGLTDGAMTEVVSVHEGDSLDEGTMLITGENAAKGATGTTNPFAPPPIFRPQQPKKQEGQ